MLYVIAPSINGVPDVSTVQVISAASISQAECVALIGTDVCPDNCEVTADEALIKLLGAPVSPPETGPMLMDIILKQAELENKIDAIGIMLVPPIPEV